MSWKRHYKDFTHVSQNTGTLLHLRTTNHKRKVAWWRYNYPWPISLLPKRRARGLLYSASCLSLFACFLGEAGFSVRPVYLGFIRHKVTVGQVFLRVLGCCPGSIMPPVFRDLCGLAVNRVVN